MFLTRDPFYSLLDAFSYTPRGQNRSEEWSPRSSILKEPSGYKILLDLPGVPKESVSVKHENNILTISGERPKIMGNVIRSGSLTGKFTRQFEFSSEVDVSKIDASLVDGVLTLVLPFTAGKATTEIQVN